MKPSQKLNRKYFNLISLLENCLGFFFFHFEIKNSLFRRVLHHFYSKERKVNYSDVCSTLKKTQHGTDGTVLNSPLIFQNNLLVLDIGFFFFFFFFA